MHHGSDITLINRQSMVKVYWQKHDKTCCEDLCFSSLLSAYKALHLVPIFRELSLLTKKVLSLLVSAKKIKALTRPSALHMVTFTGAKWSFQDMNKRHSARKADTDFDKLPVSLPIPSVNNFVLLL